MKLLVKFSTCLLIFFIILSSHTIKSQDMQKPDPVKNETFDLIMGKWSAEPYEMMGEKYNETANHYMKYGQFMFVDIQGSNDKGQTYNGTIIIKPGKDDSFTGWAFDDWGSVTTYSGTAKGNKISLTGKSDWGTETREITINGDKMEHKVTMTMVGTDGKDMTFNQTITYKKQ